MPGSDASSEETVLRSLYQCHESARCGILYRNDSKRGSAVSNNVNSSEICCQSNECGDINRDEKDANKLSGTERNRAFKAIKKKDVQRKSQAEFYKLKTIKKKDAQRKSQAEFYKPKAIKKKDAQRKSQAEFYKLKAIKKKDAQRKSRVKSFRLIRTILIFHWTVTIADSSSVARRPPDHSSRAGGTEHPFQHHDVQLDDSSLQLGNGTLVEARIFLSEDQYAILKKVILFHVSNCPPFTIKLPFDIKLQNFTRCSLDVRIKEKYVSLIGNASAVLSLNEIVVEEQKVTKAGQQYYFELTKYCKLNNEAHPTSAEADAVLDIFLANGTYTCVLRKAASQKTLPNSVHPSGTLWVAGTGILVAIVSAVGLIYVLILRRKKIAVQKLALQYVVRQSAEEVKILMPAQCSANQSDASGSAPTDTLG